MKIQLSNRFYISDITPADKSAYIEHFKEKQIYDQTLAIPFPYGESDAEWWVNHVAEETKKQGRSVNWCIRREDGYVVGGIGFHGLEPGKAHKAELGYWLAKPYWGKGIMTEAAKLASDYGFKELGLTRITANVFHFNLGSARVLEKAGFQCEGYLRQHYKKDDKIFDGKLYAKINTDQAIKAAPKYPGVGVGVVVERDGKILMLRRKYVHGSGTWSTPGGHLEFGEEPAGCGAREVKEETGITVKNLKFLEVTNDVFPEYGKHSVTIWYKAEYDSGVECIGDGSEMDQVGWYPKEDLPKPLFLPLQNLLAGKVNTV